jgi:hypothetical protein
MVLESCQPFRLSGFKLEESNVAFSEIIIAIIIIVSSVILSFAALQVFYHNLLETRCEGLVNQLLSFLPHMNYTT